MFPPSTPSPSTPTRYAPRCCAIIDPGRADRVRSPDRGPDTGRFTVGGPKGDTGPTGRKIIVDTYGGACPHGGGAFSARIRARSTARRPPWRDTSPRACSWGLAQRCCLVQLAYAIGVVEPVSVMVTRSAPRSRLDEELEALVRALSAHAEGDHRVAGGSSGRSMRRPPATVTSGEVTFLYPWEEQDHAGSFHGH